MARHERNQNMRPTSHHKTAAKIMTSATYRGVFSGRSRRAATCISTAAPTTIAMMIKNCIIFGSERALWLPQGNHVNRASGYKKISLPHG